MLSDATRGMRGTTDVRRGGLGALDRFQEITRVKWRECVGNKRRLRRLRFLKALAHSSHGTQVVYGRWQQTRCETLMISVK